MNDFLDGMDSARAFGLWLCGVLVGFMLVPYFATRNLYRHLRSI